MRAAAGMQWKNITLLSRLSAPPAPLDYITPVGEHSLQKLIEQAHSSRAGTPPSSGSSLPTGWSVLATASALAESAVTLGLEPVSPCGRSVPLTHFLTAGWEGGRREWNQHSVQTSFKVELNNAKALPQSIYVVTELAGLHNSELKEDTSQCTIYIFTDLSTSSPWSASNMTPHAV